jgi:HlyD family secretion protein
MFRKLSNILKAQSRWWSGLALACVIALVLWLGRGTKTPEDMATFAARRGPLQISLLEGGTLQALDSQELKCEVRVGFQGAKILKIIDEGYQVTEEDVRTNKVLVELDSSELQKTLVQQEIIFQSAAAALSDAQQGYDIQLNQNVSDMMAVEQKARFARMDFQKFIGRKVADEIIGQLGVDERFEAARTNRIMPHALELSEETSTNEEPSVAEETPLYFPGTTTDTSELLARAKISPEDFMPITNTAMVLAEVPSEPPRPSTIQFAKYADIELLGDGEAKQKIRKFEDDLQVAKKEIGQAQAMLEGTRRLHAKQFVTRTDLQRDEIAFENSRLKVLTAETARDLFLKYDFLKTSEETLSKYCEAVREMERARKAAIARLAQAEARLKSATAQYGVQLRQRTDLNQQIGKCLVRAQKPGLVVYGRAGDDASGFGGEERIREGASVRERQTILTIPDLSHMGVRVKIHESNIQKVRVGQKVRVTVDAFPDEELEGAVTKVGVLPDSQNRWMNPDLKVYLTTIAIEGTNDWLKPGMSTKAEVLVDHLEDVVYVPIQCAVPENGGYVCYLANGGTAGRREVEVGQFNEEFIEIKKGIQEGELVLLNPPKGTAPSATDEETKQQEKENNSERARGEAAAPAAKSASSAESTPRERPNTRAGRATLSSARRATAANNTPILARTSPRRAEDSVALPVQPSR